MKPSGTIKQAQKESLFFKEISELVAIEKQNNPAIRDVVITRVKLSPDRGMCSVYFYVSDEKMVKEARDMLVCYKPSLRKALAVRIISRHVPDILFKFDTQFVKQQQIEQLLDKVAALDSLSEEGLKK